MPCGEPPVGSEFEAQARSENDRGAVPRQHRERHHESRGAQRVERVQVPHEGCHIGICGVHHDLGDRAGLHDAAALHDDDAVAELRGFVEVVADEDDRLLEPRLQFQQFVLQPRADQRIERRERLVHQEDVGVGREGTGEADALLHAARELMRELVGPALEADHRELLVDDRVPCPARHAAQFEPHADIVAHAAPGQQRELLEHHRDPARAQVAQGAGIARADLDARPAWVTTTRPRAGRFKRFTARSSVDFPEPDRPISTQISPGATASVAPATPTTWPVSARISSRVRPASRSGNTFFGVGPNTMSTASNETAGVAPGAVTAPVPACGTSGRAAPPPARSRSRPRTPWPDAPGSTSAAPARPSRPSRPWWRSPTSTAPA